MLGHRHSERAAESRAWNLSLTLSLDKERDQKALDELREALLDKERGQKGIVGVVRSSLHPGQLVEESKIYASAAASAVRMRATAAGLSTRQRASDGRASPTSTPTPRETSSAKASSSVQSSPK